MKKLLPIVLFFLVANFSNAQSTIVGLIGEFTGWSEDAIMTNDLTDLNKYTFELNLLPSDDTNDPQDGIVEMKFRENLDWGTNWGAADFPSGTATVNGANIPVPVGNYLVEFDKSTGAYSFTSRCGQVSIIGELTGWGDDINLTRDAANPDMWTGFIGLTAGSDTNDPADGIVELKFRQNADWGVNWGDAAFPTGVAAANGANIPVPVGSYDVSFNCATGDYSFTSVPGSVGVVGEFTNWGGDPDATMTRNGNDWSTVITVNESHDLDGSGMVDVKFRENSDWGTNWGAGSGADPTCDTGELNGANVALAYGSYAVTFNDQTLAYCFTPTCGQVSMIGAFIGWNGDVNLTRSTTDPNMWTGKRSFYADSEMKFRENADWTVNWGDASFPSGTATAGGPNIPLTAGEYTISFNCATGAYSFTPSSDLPCGEVGIIGAFNNFGTADPATDPATDVWMERDPVTLSDFTLFYNFDASTGFYFREDGQPISNTSIWGGTNFPIGAAVKDVTQQLQVAGGKYNIHFNCITGFYEFERLGNSAVAPKVFNMSIDGTTDEADWTIDRTLNNVIDGTPAMGSTDASAFGITYNDTYIFVGVNVTDNEVNSAGTPTQNDHVKIYIDGDKSGGDYTDADIAFFVDAAGTVGTIAGNMTATVDGGTAATADGYSVEGRVAWADLGVDPNAIGGIGFDVIVQDVDGMDTVRYAWNGNLGNDASTGAFGDVSLGGLECGNISMYGASIGDVGLNTLTASPTTYVATFEFTSAEDIVFRKDNADVVSWGGGTTPSGTATLGGDAINVAAGRYMVSFDCSSLDYSFTDAPATTCVAISNYTGTAVTIDGDLAEYTLDQVMDLTVDGADPNNTITWGTTWDNDNLYIAANVVDGTILTGGSVNPWEQDAVEVYIDGNHDADGDYDADKDVQLIIWDDAGATQVWDNGGPAAGVEAVYATTADGFSVEIKMPLSNIGFVPGAGRTIGFTIGTNDADNVLGTRENQVAWCGTGGNFNNTSDFGDLQFAGGATSTKTPYINNEILVYPNPATEVINIQPLSNSFDNETNVRMFDLLGRTLLTQKMNLQNGNAQINVSTIPTGVFFLELVTEDGKVAIKKIVIE